MAHSKQNKCHCSDCEHARKRHRSKDRDTSKEKSGKDGHKDKKHAKEPKPSEPSTPQVHPALRVWSQWTPVQNWDYFWRGKMGDDGSPEYQFTIDFVNIYPQRELVPVGGVRLVKSEYPVSTSQESDVIADFQGLSLDMPARAPSGKPLPRASVVAPQRPPVAVPMQALPPATSKKMGTPKREPSTSRKTHTSSRKLGTLVKAERNLRLDSSSKVSDWYLEWDE